MFHRPVTVMLAEVFMYHCYTSYVVSFQMEWCMFLLCWLIIVIHRADAKGKIGYSRYSTVMLLHITYKNIPYQAVWMRWICIVFHLAPNFTESSSGTGSNNFKDQHFGTKKRATVKIKYLICHSHAKPLPRYNRVLKWIGNEIIANIWHFSCKIL